MMMNSIQRDVIQKAERIFLNPDPLYSYDEIIQGCYVEDINGDLKKMYAVGTNTWRGFRRLNKSEDGSSTVFIKHFLDNKDYIINNLKDIRSANELDEFEDEICKAIRKGLANIDSVAKASYNKIRKPVDLYIEHIVSLSKEMNPYRKNLIEFLFIPLDSQIIGSPYIFTDYEIQRHGLRRNSTFKDITNKSTYQILQDTLISKTFTMPGVKRIYFDLLWNDRYKMWGNNLFETNLSIKA